MSPVRTTTLSTPGLAVAALDDVVDPVAGRLVTVPLVRVQEQAAAGRVRQAEARRLQLREHHALAQHLPARGATAQLVEEPRLLLGAEQLAGSGR